jgi:hypothetical protein
MLEREDYSANWLTPGFRRRREECFNGLLDGAAGGTARGGDWPVNFAALLATLAARCAQVAEQVDARDLSLSSQAGNPWLNGVKFGEASATRLVVIPS